MHFVYKTDNLTIRVSHGNSCVIKGFHFLELIWTHSFSVFKMHHSKPHHRFSTLSDFICYFSCIYWFFSYMTLKMKSSTNEIWKGWNLAWYHHFTHIACARKLRGLRQKLDALRVQNAQSLSKYQGFIRKLVYYKGISFFWTYLNSILFLCLILVCFIIIFNLVMLRLFKKWNAFVTVQFSSETLILRKRLSILYTKCIQFLP